MFLQTDLQLFSTCPAKHKREMVLLTIINLNLLTSRDELQLQPQEVPHLKLRKMTNIMWYEESGPHETFVLI